MPERRLPRPLRPFSRLILAALAAACLPLSGPLSDFVPNTVSRLASSAHAADISVLGGSGGGGGGGKGATYQSFGGNFTNNAGSLGGQGGIGATDGNAGGGGGAGSVNGSDTVDRKGGDATGATPGAAGTNSADAAFNGTAGTGPSGNAGGAGGNGGTVTHNDTAATADNIFVEGGRGGQGGQGGTVAGENGGAGGNGGASTLTLDTMNVAGTVNVQGGNGGNGIRESGGSGTSGTGGTGGNASLDVTGKLTVVGELRVFSGSQGTESANNINPGTGGNVSFTANTLAAPSIILLKNIGSNLAFNVTTLDVTSGDTRIELGRTVAGTSSTAAGGDGVYIGTAKLGNGVLMIGTAYGSGGAALIDTLELVGSGTFDDTANPITLGKLALNGGTLNAANWSGIVEHSYTDNNIELRSGGGTVHLEAGENKTLSRNLMNGAGPAAALTKTGAGVLTLSGTNNYTGATNINGGTLRLAVDTAVGQTSGFDTGTASRARAATGTGTLELAFGGAFDKPVSGAGELSINSGTGATVLLNTNSNYTYTGMTTVKSGILKAGSGVSLASSSGLTLYGGAGFDNTNNSHSLDGKILAVNGANGQSATYRGNLSAVGADLHFIAPVNPTQPLLKVTGNADISNSTYNVGLDGGTQLAAGSQLTLLEVTGTGNTLKADNLRKGNGIVQIGSTVAHDITANTAIDPASGRLVVNVAQGHATEQAKALSEGFLGGMALAVQGADLVAGRGMQSAVSAAGNAGANGTGGTGGFAGFGALSGGSLRYNTGSHVDMRSLSLLTGLAWGVDLAPGRFTVGAFFEYGNGSYNTHNSFSNAADVDGDGNTYYLGGGILARMDFAPAGQGRFYAEASGRAGNIHNAYDSSDLRDASGRTANYDSDSPYYGLHFGAGYVWEITDKASLDLYVKYFWTRQQGTSVDLSTGEDLSFKDADSSRLRFGGRFAYALNEHVSPYLGAAWEHEFDGRARAATNGYDIDAPNLRGDTGIGELGLSLTPSVDLPLTVDLGVQGYTGKREGVTGSVQVKFEF